MFIKQIYYGFIAVFLSALYLTVLPLICNVKKFPAA